MVEIKFCGMMRSEDARHAASLGARYVGVILADGPRMLTDDAAIAVLSAVPSGAGVARVGVFGDASPEQVAVRADRLGLDVVQLHGDPDARVIADVRGLWSGQVWAVLRIEGSAVPAAASDLFDVADAVVLDARVPGKLGGTGVALHWNELRERMETFRTRRARLVLAGGLRPENVASAVDELHPDVVDVSSGVEARVGVKDHGRMRAFRDAVHAMQIR
jgi:phosphoribosylanthranilate isomerase